MTLSIKERWGILIFIKINFNIFYVIMKRVPVEKVLNDLYIKYLMKLILLNFQRLPMLFDL